MAKTNKKTTNKNSANKRKGGPKRSKSAPPKKLLKKDGIEVLETIIPKKSNHDPNTYRIVKLSNGLTAILISRNKCSSRFNVNGSCRRSLDMNLFPSSRFFFPSTCSKLQFQPDMNISNSVIPIPSHEPFPNPLWSENDDHFGNFKPRPNVSTTCVALTVSVGCFDDPFGTQGLAHFMEHMVHYGSERFPEDSQEKLLVNIFRRGNAVTRSQSTSYYNAVPDNILDKNLSIFVDMLVKPLFAPEMLALEVNAVDSECYLGFPIRKIHFLIGYIAVVKKTHPLVRFGCGNLETLTDCLEKNGKNMRMKMMTHHDTNYVPSAMTVAIYGKQSLDELEKLVLHHFKNFCPAKDKGGDANLLYKAQQQELPQMAKASKPKGYLYAYMEGHHHFGSLLLSWHLDASVFGIRNINEQNKKVMQMMRHLLSNTSEGSLAHHLIRERLIISMHVDMSRTRYSSQIVIDYGLTEKGRENTIQVIEETLAYIKKVSGNGCSSTDEDRTRMKQHFGDIRVAKLRQFHYGSQDTSLDLTERLTISMQYEENLEEILRKNSWYYAIFNYESVSSGFKAMLNKDHLIIMEILPSGVQLGTKCKKAEVQPPAPYVNAVYAVTTKAFGEERKTEFSLPQENLLIKEIKIAEKYEVDDGAGDREFGRWMPCKPPNYGDIQPHMLNFNSAMDRGNYAKISGIHFGHKEVSNNRYACQVDIYFQSVYISQINTPRMKALMLLWSAVVDRRLLTKRSEFHLAGYKLRIYNNMAISVGGFPTHLIKILQAVFDEMLDAKQVTQDEFGLAHELTKAHAYMRTSDNHYITQSILQMLPYVRSCPASASSYDLVQVLDKIKLEDLQMAIENVKRSASCFVLMRDNVTDQHFIEIANILERKKFGQTSSNPLPQILPSPKVFSKPGETCMRIINQKSPEYTTAVTNLYVMGYKTGNSKEPAFIELSLELLKKQAFTYLRTEAQLGYIVYAQRAYQRDFLGSGMWAFYIHVTSTAKNFTACAIDKKIDEFLAQFGNSLKNSQEYEEIVNMFKELRFGYDEVTKDELGDWFNSIFGPEFNSHHPVFNKCTLRGIQKLSIQVLPGNPDARTKQCCCPRCSSEIQWIPGNGESLLFAKAVNGTGKDYFVDSLLS